jgi:hypothetical protein
MDKRKCYRMESGYCSSDFTFYQKYPESAEGDQYAVYKFQQEAGNTDWFLKNSYTYRSTRNTSFSEQVLVLVNSKGIQIETSGYGWYRVVTEHEQHLKEHRDYKKFIDALAECGKLCPRGASRWFNEAVLENFENTFEEILYYGTESV